MAIDLDELLRPYAGLWPEFLEHDAIGYTLVVALVADSACICLASSEPPHFVAALLVDWASFVTTTCTARAA